MNDRDNEKIVKVSGQFRMASGFREGDLSNTHCVLLDEPVKIEGAFFDAAYFVGFDVSRYNLGDQMDVIAQRVSRDNSEVVKADATYGYSGRSDTVDVLVVRAVARMDLSL